MKNLILFLTLALVGQCYGQRQALLGYRYNGVSEVKNFLTDSLTAETSKAIQFKNFLFLKTGESNLDKLFSKIKIGSVDTTLLEKSYQNSCWVVDSTMIKTYLGKARRCQLGIAYYHPKGGGRIELWIVDCGNEITFLFPLSKNDEQPYVASQVQVILVDTLHLKVYVYDSIPCDTCCPSNSYVTNITYYGDGEDYAPTRSSSFYSRWLGYQWSWYSGGQLFRDDHHCRIETNYYTTNNSWTSSSSQIILPKPEPGGRVTPPGSGIRKPPAGHDDPGDPVTPPGDGVRKVPPPHEDPVVWDRGTDDYTKLASSSKTSKRSRREETLPTVKGRVAQKIQEKKDQFKVERSKTETNSNVKTERSRRTESKTFSSKTVLQQSKKESLPAVKRRESPVRRTEYRSSNNKNGNSSSFSGGSLSETHKNGRYTQGGGRPTSSGNGTRSGSSSTRGARR